MKKIVLLFVILISFLQVKAQEAKGISNIGPLLPPVITIITPSTNPCSVSASVINVIVNFKNVKSEKDIKFTNIKHNKVLSHSQQNEAGGLNELKKTDSSNTSVLTWYIDLEEGTNEFEIIAKNEFGLETKKITIDYQKIKLPQIWAVVIGLSKYQQSEISLKYADKDAQAYYDYLKSPFGGNTSAENSALLINENATRENIIKEITEKCNKAFENDMVIVYLACHGMPDAVGDEIYFLGYDAKIKNLAGTAVSMFDIDKALKKSRANKKIWLIDACHSGGASFSYRGDYAYLTNKLLLEIALRKEAYAIFTASSASEFSREDTTWGGGHGVFTFHLLEALNGAADKNGDGLIDIRELQEYVTRHVTDETNGEQHPELKGNFDNKMPLGIIKKDR
jgi:hypothetical protein